MFSITGDTPGRGEVGRQIKRDQCTVKQTEAPGDQQFVFVFITSMETHVSLCFYAFLFI